LSFKPAENDADIEKYFQTGITHLSLASLQLSHMAQVPHPRRPEWAGKLSTLLVMGCQEIFYPRLKSEIIPSDFKFFGYEDGLEVDGESPNYVFTLGQKQKEGNLKIPLLLLQEVIGFDNLEKETPQFSKYAKKIFAQQISVGEKTLGFESVYLLALSQKTRQVKLLQYKRPGKNQALGECVASTIPFGLFENGTDNMSLNYFNDLIRVLFNCISLQLKSLDLIK